MSLQIEGFIEDKTEIFMTELWKLLLSAQKEPNGIPVELVEEKKNEN